MTSKSSTNQTQGIPFAPAERRSGDHIKIQHETFRSSGATRLVDTLPHLILVLNDCRQMVYCNEAVLKALAFEQADALLGLRPGEILGCIHAVDAGDCGTTEFCSQCGAVKAILSAIEGRSGIQECRLLRNVGNGVEAMDLLVCASPFEMAEERLTVFSVTDISHENRRRALERIFFHDLLNKAGGIRGLVQLLAEDAPEEMRQEMQVLHTHFISMVDEIQSQKALSEAENNELSARHQIVSADTLLNEVLDAYRRHEAAAGKRIDFAPETCRVAFVTDPTLLGRVLGNMLKNALEASTSGQTVHVECRADAENIAFEVHNPGHMPRETQLQVFKRSFSTKGPGRGLGTFSMKLITERYLDGMVSFSSTPEDGTTFRIELPRHPRKDKTATGD